jgi:hypothetical protein
MTKEMNEVKKTLSEETIIDNEVFTIEETFYTEDDGDSCSCDYRLIIKPSWRFDDPYEIRLCGESFRYFLQKMYETQSTHIVSNT